ncbi:hypothetical protein D3C71_1202830 [compost metagenome]
MIANLLVIIDLELCKAGNNLPRGIVTPASITSASSLISIIFVSIYIIGILEAFKFIVGIVVRNSSFCRQTKICLIGRKEIHISCKVFIVFIAGNIAAKESRVIGKIIGMIDIFRIVICVGTYSRPIFHNSQNRREVSIPTW